MSTSVQQRQTVVVTSAAQQTVVTVGAQGPRGPQGSIGPQGPIGDATFLRTSAGELSALRAVWEDAAGVVHLLDYRDAAHIDLLAGITVTAAGAAGHPVTVQRSGVLDAAGLGLAPGRVWLGAAGALTQTPADDGFDVLIGTAVAPGRLILNPQDPIHLE